MDYHASSTSSSPASSASSSPISIGWPSPRSNSSASSNLSSLSSYSSTSSSSFSSSPSQLNAHCAFPSWSFFGSSAPSSYISDADLFPDDLLDSAPLLDEAPPPPRVIPAVAAPLLPLYASEKPKTKRRRSSGKKRPAPAKPMTPIAESPLAAPE